MVKCALRAMTDEKLFCVYLKRGEGSETHTRAAEIISRSTPEDAVADLIDLPRSNERDVALDGGFHQITPPIELPRLLLIPWKPHAALEPALVVPNGDRPMLDSGGRARWREKRGHTSGVGAKPAYERALRDEL